LEIEALEAKKIDDDVLSSVFKDVLQQLEVEDEV